METILRKFRFLDSEKYGNLVKYIFDYCDDKDAADADAETLNMFECFAKKDIDKMLRERKRNNVNRGKLA